MNFLCAIKHAAINYGIRRRVWVSSAILSLSNGCELYWLETSKGGKHGDDLNPPCKLLGPDKAYDLQPEDIVAQDWEVV